MDKKISLKELPVFSAKSFFEVLDRPAIDKIKRITCFFYLPRPKLKESLASFVSRGQN
jgi:hypothetical protein